ncbi:hypothetical protein H310_07842 [Aphanomyces invadans]|uniref:Uncharacterized protein n=1 Tax=Aphanomyces invadans TaxID=157072 RepID=A0A024U1N2_9STRA|nr:hypothetical protein H310_07842 [Aphanomyces invadans]ETV99796.1 hypothetical protein H310_07842 [Aphanomyces invadans]|eukprot:XP_008871572.1 hypothetical protein H310_07842 [Aphanomyces invadans]
MHGHVDDNSLETPLVDESAPAIAGRIPNESLTMKSGHAPCAVAAPSAGPNPYAVPQYDPSDSFSGHEAGWPRPSMARSNLSPLGSRLDVWVSGIYTVVAGLTMIQGFGILLHLNLTSVILGMYLMAFSAGLVLYDLKSVVCGVTLETWFPFLGNYLGRGFTLLFLFALNAQNFQFFQLPMWVTVVEGIGAALHFAIFMTTQPQ